MNDKFEAIILEACKARGLGKGEMIQSLWSGYGSIVRYKPVGGKYESIVVKHVKLAGTQKRSGNNSHPRGWNTNFSHKRKLKSYNVEMAFYRNYAKHCDDSCRIPHCLAQKTSGDEILMVLEDLDSAGFPSRRRTVNMNQISQVLIWLANFHAIFLATKPSELWRTGTYWHLETRPDELQVLDDKPLKESASGIDTVLKNAKYQTFVHGDAKLENFCFSSDGSRVAAVDFQYVGGGCGMKDVAYFVGSCLNELESERQESQILSIYFDALQQAVITHNKNVDFEELKSEWSKLYCYAWADFHRFLKGWSPGHWKINSYSEKICQKVIKEFQGLG